VQVVQIPGVVFEFSVSAPSIKRLLVLSGESRPVFCHHEVCCILNFDLGSYLVLHVVPILFFNIDVIIFVKCVVRILSLVLFTEGNKFLESMPLKVLIERLKIK